MPETDGTKTVKSNRMGTEPVHKLLLTMALPMIISLAVQALYNIVDTMWVGMMPGEVGDAEAALTALTYAFPVQMLIIAFGIGTGVGANAAASRALGEGDREKASRIAGNALFLGVVIYAVFLLFAVTPLCRLYVGMYGNADENVVSYTVTYLTICCTLSVFNVFYNLYEKILQSTGRSWLTMAGQVSGAVANIILDPVFITTLGLGIAGAAWATIIGQVLSFGLDLTFHMRFNREIRNGFRYWRPDKKIMGQIFSIGLPAIISQALMSFMTMFMSVFLTRLDNEFFLTAEGAYTASYASAYGTFYKLQQFILFLAFGVRDSVTPVGSYNYGMGDTKRVRETVRYGMIYAEVLMAVCVVAVEIWAEPLLSLFAGGLSEGSMEIAVEAARYISVSFLFAGVCIIFQGAFQALHSGTSSLVVSLLRQLVLVIPLVAAFTYGIIVKNRDMDFLNWVTFIFAEAVSAAVALVVWLRLSRKRLSPVRGGGEKATGEAVAGSPAEGSAER